jgi:hypothetical protein
MLGTHPRFSRLPPIKYQSQIRDDPKVRHGPCVGAALDARWIRISRVCAAGLFGGSGRRDGIVREMVHGLVEEFLRHGVLEASDEDWGQN